MFEQALKIDPNDADALAGDASSCLNEYSSGWANPETDYDAKVLGQADRAIAIARDNTLAYHAKSLYLVISRRPDEGLRTAEAGLAINPNYAILQANRRIAQSYLPQFQQAKSDVQQACG